MKWTRLSSVSGQLPPAPGGDEQTASVVGDVDGDGDMDFFIADRSVSPSIYLYRYDEGAWSRSVVERRNLAIEAGGTLADIDEDGDLDLVFGQDYRGGEVWWWENPLPTEPITSTWRRRFIKSGGRQQHDQGFGDFDGDGKLEFATWVNREQRLEIYEIPSNPRSFPWPRVEVINMVGEGLHVDDIDLDGKVDILAGTRWIRHHVGNSYRSFSIEPNYPTDTSRIVSGQFIPGGRPEVVINSGDAPGPLRFYRFDGSRWIRSNLMDDVDHGHTLEVGDIDRDGNLDFFAAEMGNPGAGAEARAWIAWGDGAGNFDFEILSVGLGNHESRLADLDGDGDLDILSKPYSYGAPRIDIFINEGTSGILSLDHWQRHSVDPDMPWQPLDVTAADLDGDGLLDIISGGWWYRNPGRIDGNWQRRTIGGQLHNMGWVHDFDGDGDLDIFGTNGRFNGGRMGWAQNDGTGQFAYRGNVASSQNRFFQGALGASFTPGDPYQVVMQWEGGEEGGSGVEAFTVPSDPVNGFWSKTVIHPRSSGEQLSGGDIDGDGDLDIFQGASWLRNDGGGQWRRFDIANIPARYGQPDRNRLVDIDGDGDLDAVVGLAHFSGSSTRLIWLECPSDPTRNWASHVVSEGVWGGYSLDAKDIDYDGDVDLLLGEHRGATRALIYENRDNGSRWVEHVADTGGPGIDHHVGTKLFDLDGDGDLDIVSIGWDNDRLWIIENQAPAVEDSEPPTPPSNLSATSVVGPSIHLAWSPSTDNLGVRAYLVYRDGKQIAAVESNTSFKDSNISAGESYSYHIVATDSRGNRSSPSETATVAGSASPGGWWNSTWDYRLFLAVDAAGYARKDAVADVGIDFSGALAQQGVSARIDASAIRVVEVDEAGSLLNPAVPSQFDPAADFDAASNASGRLIFPLVGETKANATRYFHVYLAQSGSGASPLVFAPQVALLDGVLDQGQESIQITTLSGDLYYHKKGAGFSSWNDIEGRDWIGYAPSGNERGNYRGIPNMVYPEGHFHPGSTSGQTIIENHGPLKATFRSSVDGGAWECRWEVYGHFARLTVLKAAKPYWFVYEGPPGGTFDADSDRIVRATGASTLVSQSWQGDLPGDEWFYATDPALGRSLFFALREEDEAIDSYRPFRGAMTVLAFGRNLVVDPYLSGTPKTFTMGLVEATAFEPTRSLIESAYKELAVSILGLEERKDDGLPSAPSGNVVSNGGFEDGLASWSFFSDASGDATVAGAAFSGSQAVRISVDSRGSNIQLFHPDIELQPNTRYALSFAAYSNSGNDLNVSLNQHVSPFANYGLSRQTVDLTTGWQLFTIEFTTLGFARPVSDGRLYFWFADNARPGDRYYLDRIVLSVADDQPPSVPQGLAVQLNAQGEARLSWLASSDNVGVASYRVLRDGKEIGSADNSEFIDAGVAASETHRYRVAAVDEAGNVSEPSSEVVLEASGGPADPVPADNAVENGNFESGLHAWTFYTDAGGRAGIVDASFAGNSAIELVVDSRGSNVQLFHPDVALEPNTEYELRFAAYSTSGNDLHVSLHQHVVPYANYGLKRELADLGTGWQTFSMRFTTVGFSAPVKDGRLYFWLADHARAGDRYYLDQVVLLPVNPEDGFDVEPPSVPLGLRADAVSVTQAQLSWEPSSDNVGVASYQVYRDGSEYSEAATTVFVDSSLSPGSSHRYAVAAIDGNGNASALSNEIVVTPGASAIANAVSNGDFETGLEAWTFYADTSAQASVVDQGFSGGRAAQISINARGGNIQLFHPGMDLQPGIEYELRFAAYSTSGHDLNVSLQQHGKPYTNYGLNRASADLGQEWQLFSIRFQTRGFASPVSDGRLYFWFADDARAGDRYFLDQVHLAPAGPPDAEPPTSPKNLASRIGQDRQVQLTWEAAADNVGVAVYRVKRDGSVLAETGATEYLDASVVPGALHRYRVEAIDEAGNVSKPSDEAVVLAAFSPDPDLLAGFGFEEEDGNLAFDFSRHANDGRLLRGVRRSEAGRFGRAVVFGPNRGGIDLGQLDAPGSELTLAAWIKPDSFAIHDARIISKATGVEEEDHFWMLSTIEDNGIKPRMRLKTASGASTLVGSSNIPSGIWTHVAATYDGSRMRLYINGSLDASLPKSGAIAQQPSVSAAVGNQPQGGRGFEGVIDDVRIYLRALDDSELSQISGQPVAHVSSPDVTPPSVPQALVATATSSSGAQLTWSESSDEVGTLGYFIYRNGVDVGTSLDPSFLDSGLDPMTAYSYRVSAFDLAGNESARSAAAQAETLQPGSDIVKNGSFESGMESWAFYADGLGSAAAEEPGFKGSEHGAVVSLQSPGSNIQLMQTGVGLQPNTQYRLTFAAYSSSGSDMRVSLHQHGFPFANYGLNREKIDLSKKWQAFSITFTTPSHVESSGDGRLYFWFADDAEAGDVYFIDQVALAKP